MITQDNQYLDGQGGGGVQLWQKLRIITPDKSPLIVVDR
ncbi:hypothetical protein SPLC1_S220330 [Arthrospira platensis C1]|nr:hypothetical protein SPLC1_S220330 [Arthrospira platensis C1]